MSLITIHGKKRTGKNRLFSKYLNPPYFGLPDLFQKESHIGKDHWVIFSWYGMLSKFMNHVKDEQMAPFY